MARVTLNPCSNRIQVAGPAFSSSLSRFQDGQATFVGLHANSTRLHHSPQKLKGKRHYVPVKAAANEDLSPAYEHFSEKPPTPLLDTVNLPVDMKKRNIQDLQQLADELRTEVIFSFSKTGGHLGSCLGVVDLTVALHYVFNALEDKILWDAGHQTIYPHKILTGRRSMMHTMRKENGLSGFTKRAESAFDAFGGGHSSTTLSAALGMAVARDLQGESNSVVAVIGDGAMTAGIAYEAVNNAGFLDSDLIVILNDNRPDSFPAATSSVLDEPAAVSRYVCPVQLAADLQSSKNNHKVDTHQMVALADGATLFRELGFYYIGPVDGHNVKDLVTILRNVKSIPAHGPVLIHVVTKKGHGYPDAEHEAPENLIHGVTQFDYSTGKQRTTETYTDCFGDALLAEAEADSSIVAIHARIGGGAGLKRFEKKFPERAFNVGIAEQHAVTFAAGLATEGLKPFCAISSSLLQRGYDQVVHDVDLQKLPVRFAVDGAGLAGEDGATHCGAFDVTYMACLPNMIVMAPADEVELVHMVATAAAIDDRPSCFRFPRGIGIGVKLPGKGVPLQIGKGRVLIEGKRVAILGYGSAVKNCVAAHTILSSLGHSVTVADARFCKPLDGELITRLAREHEILITVEEGAVGGFSAHVAQFLALHGLLDTKLKWRPMGLPDRYIDQGTHDEQIEKARLSCKHIAAMVLECLGDASGGDGEYHFEVMRPDFHSK